MKTHHPIIALVFFYCFMIQGQSIASVNPDSLYKILKETQTADTVRAKALYSISFDIFLNSIPDSAFYYAQQLATFTNKKNLPVYNGRAYYLMGLIKYREGDYKEGLKYYQQSLDLVRKGGDLRDLSILLLAIGNLNADLGNIQAATDYYSQSIETRKRLGNKAMISQAYIKLAALIQEQGQLAKAMEYFLAALKIYEQDNNKKGLAMVYSYIGGLYFDQEDYNSALKAFRQALNIRQQMNDIILLPSSMINMGVIYKEKGLYDSALLYYKLAYEMAVEQQSPKTEANVLANIGAVYHEKGNEFAAHSEIRKRNENYDLALDYYDRSCKILKAIGDLPTLSVAFRNKADVLRMQGQTKRALIEANESLRLAYEVKSQTETRDAAQVLYDLYKEEGKYKEALKMYEQYISASNIINNEQNKQEVMRLQFNYEYNKKAAADSITNAEAKKVEAIKHHAEINRQKTYTYGGIGGFVVMILVAAFSFIAFRNKKKANLEIAQQKALIEQKQKEVLDSIYYARRIQRALITNEKYIKRNLDKLKKK